MMEVDGGGDGDGHGDGGLNGRHQFLSKVPSHDDDVIILKCSVSFKYIFLGFISRVVFILFSR